MTATLAPPPGQLGLWPPAPGARPSSLRVVTTTPVGPAIRDLVVASLQADHAATCHGDAWLVAPDGSWAHIDGPTGIVTPFDGWAAMAARVITTRRSTTTR